MTKLWVFDETSGHIFNGKSGHLQSWFWSQKYCWPEIRTSSAVFVVMKLWDFNETSGPIFDGKSGHLQLCENTKLGVFIQTSGHMTWCELGTSPAVCGQQNKTRYFPNLNQGQHWNKIKNIKFLYKLICDLQKHTLLTYILAIVLPLVICVSVTVTKCIIIPNLCTGNTHLLTPRSDH